MSYNQWMAYILYDQGKKIGEVSEWTFKPYEPVYKNILGKMVLAPEKPDECSFVVPKPVSRKSQLTIVEDQKIELTLQIKSVKGMTVSAAIVAKQDIEKG